MELRHLRYFIKSAELLHFTEAAAALHVSQPNLSLQIQQLEEELGARLFERVGRAVHLTAAGELFLTYAREALREVEAGQRGIHDLDGLLRGTLRIGVTHAFSAEMFPRMLAEFIRAHAAIHVSVTVGTNGSVEAGIRDGKFDLGLVHQSAKASDFNSIELFKHDIVLAVSRNHHLAGSAALHIGDLERVPLALPTPDAAARQVIDRAFAAADIDPMIIVEANDIDVLLGLAKHGVAATILEGEAAAHLLVGNISTIRFNEEGFVLGGAFIWPAAGHNSAPAARFLELAGRHRYPTRVRRPRRK